MNMSRDGDTQSFLNRSISARFEYTWLVVWNNLEHELYFSIYWG